MSALSVAEVISHPCARRRHQACQLGADCACLCHTPEGLPKSRPAIEKCDTLREATTTWMVAIEGTYVVADEGVALCAYMRQKAPDIFARWLDEHAEALVARLINHESSPRQVWSGRNSMSPRSVFADAAEAYEAGDKNALDYLSTPYVIDDQNTRSVLRNLTYDDLSTPIESYDQRAKANAMEAAYLRAVQKRLPKDNSKTVGDVFTNEELSALREAAA